MKKLLLAVALVVSFAAPAMAEQFPNSIRRLHRPVGHESRSAVCNDFLHPLGASST